jgi:hypothetical protein
MNFNFGEVLTRAWQIIRKHNVLWIFGIFAGCSRGSANFRGNTGGGGSGGPGQPNIPPEVMRILEFIQQNLVTFIVVACLLLLLIWAITIFLSTIGRVGLIRGTYQVEQGAERLIFGQLFSESMPYFWRVFGLSLIVAIPILIVFAILIGGLVAFAVSASNGNDAARVGIFGFIPLLIGCFCLLIPILFVVSMVIRQAENAIVLEDLPMLPALSRGWEVFKANLGPILLMAIILVVIGLIVGFIVALPVIAIVAPAAVAFAFNRAQNWTPMIFAGVCLCLYIPVAWVLNGILTAYTESAWTLTYMRLTTKPEDIPPVAVEANA